MTPRDPLLGNEPVTGELVDGRYRLEGRIGRGGMARVYRATDTVLGRTVAIKLFDEVEDSSTDAQRMLVEIRALARAEHPALVTLLDANLDPTGVPYLVMELVDGPTLRQRLRDGPLSPRDTAALLTDLASGLAVVHGAGMVHRDVKPSNVLLSPDSSAPGGHRAKLTDFGIAYLVDTTRLTRPGSLIGTVAYMSPELVRGSAPAASSDVYSLGLLVLECLTGRHAFPATTTQEALAARLGRDPDVPAWLRNEWRSVLRSMTAKEPRLRPTAAQIAEVAERLHNLPDARHASVGITATRVWRTQSRTVALTRAERATAALEETRPMDAPLRAPRRSRAAMLTGAVLVVGASLALAFSFGALAAQPAPAADVPPVIPTPVPTPASDQAALDPSVAPDVRPNLTPAADTPAAPGAASPTGNNKGNGNGNGNGNGKGNGNNKSNGQGSNNGQGNGNEK